MKKRIANGINQIESKEFRKPEIYLGEDKPKIEKSSLLLHSCCGPCSTAVIERLIENYNLTIYFFNPNITSQEEYKKRLDTQLEVIKWLEEDKKEKISFIKGDYDPGEFYHYCSDYAALPEGDRRCQECFSFRLEKTAQMSTLHNFDLFTTTLTVSPRKNSQAINSIGKSISVKYQIEFMDADFKKKGGYQRSVEMSKEIGIYRQKYCGCEYSFR